MMARPHPFSDTRIEARRPAGGTVAELMRSVDVPYDRIFARVFIDDRLVPWAEWEQARPVAGCGAGSPPGSPLLSISPSAGGPCVPCLEGGPPSVRSIML